MIHCLAARGFPHLVGGARWLVVAAVLGASEAAVAAQSGAEAGPGVGQAGAVSPRRVRALPPLAQGPLAQAQSLLLKALPDVGWTPQWPLEEELFLQCFSPCSLGGGLGPGLQD